MSVRMQAWPALGLASCAMGLIASPYGYIAMGALGHFAPAFSALTLPPLFLASSFLLWRFLRRPRDGAALPILEGISWVVILAFIVLISGYSLFTPFERLGLFATVFLLASVLSSGFLLTRDSTLERRLKRWPRGVSIALLILILGASGVAMSAYQLSDPGLL